MRNKFEFTYIHQSQRWKEELLKNKRPHIDEEIAIRKIPVTRSKN
jgi:hypothetical protein